MQDLYQKFRDVLAEKRRILIVSHRKPDADTLGAAIALGLWFEREQKDVVYACIDKPSRVFSFLPGVDKFVQEFDLNDFDLLVVVDAGASYMTGFENVYPNFLKPGIPLVNIDHHASNDLYGDLNIVDPKAASTTLMIYRMFKYLGVDMDDCMATALIAGLYGDTGSFMHSNTTPEVLAAAADLMAANARVADIVRSLFKSRSVATLRLWGKVLEKTKVVGDNVVVATVTEQDYEKAGASPDNLSGVVDYLNMIPGANFSVLINEDRKGNVKGSFRTRRQDVDLSLIAGKFGGGGHPKAAGFTLPGRLEEEVNYKIVSTDLSKKTLDF